MKNTYEFYRQYLLSEKLIDTLPQTVDVKLVLLALGVKGQISHYSSICGFNLPNKITPAIVIMASANSVLKSFMGVARILDEALDIRVSYGPNYYEMSIQEFNDIYPQILNMISVITDISQGSFMDIFLLDGSDVIDVTQDSSSSTHDSFVIEEKQSETDVEGVKEISKNLKRFKKNKKKKQKECNEHVEHKEQESEKIIVVETHDADTDINDNQYNIEDSIDCIDSSDSVVEAPKLDTIVLSDPGNQEPNPLVDEVISFETYTPMDGNVTETQYIENTNIDDQQPVIGSETVNDNDVVEVVEEYTNNLHNISVDMTELRFEDNNNTVEDKEEIVEHKSVDSKTEHNSKMSSMDFLSDEDTTNSNNYDKVAQDSRYQPLVDKNDSVLNRRSRKRSISKEDLYNSMKSRRFGR